MRVEVDQSGKIEETQHDTVLAFSNSVTYSMRITARTKRRLQEMFRQIGEPRLFVPYVFGVSLYYLLEKMMNTNHTVIIDEEYLGKSQTIHKLMRSIAGSRNKLLPSISFHSIGKRSPAHTIAISGFRNPETTNRVLTLELISKECFIKKNGYPVLKYRHLTLR